MNLFKKNDAQYLTDGDYLLAVNDLSHSGRSALVASLTVIESTARHGARALDCGQPVANGYGGNLVQVAPLPPGQQTQYVMMLTSLLANFCCALLNRNDAHEEQRKPRAAELAARNIPLNSWPLDDLPIDKALERLTAVGSKFPEGMRVRAASQRMPHTRRPGLELVVFKWSPAAVAPSAVAHAPEPPPAQKDEPARPIDWMALCPKERGFLESMGMDLDRRVKEACATRPVEPARPARTDPYIEHRLHEERLLNGTANGREADSCVPVDAPQSEPKTE